MKRILLWYALFLFACLFLSMQREGFESSPAKLFIDIANKKVFVLLYTTSCGYCTKLKPDWDKAEASVPSKMVSIDVTDQSNPSVKELVTKLNVTSYPFMVVMDNGTVTDTYSGGRTAEDLLAYVKEQNI